MNQSNLQSAQRSFDNELPEPDLKFCCRMCGEWRFESDRAVKNQHVCAWCEEEADKI